MTGQPRHGRAGRDARRCHWPSGAAAAQGELQPAEPEPRKLSFDAAAAAGVAAEEGGEVAVEAEAASSRLTRPPTSHASATPPRFSGARTRRRRSR